MRYRACLDFGIGSSYWYTVFKSTNEIIKGLHSAGKLHKIETGQANEFAYISRKGGTLGSMVLIVDDSHPLFNISLFIYDDHEESPWGDEKDNYIDNFIQSMIRSKTNKLRETII